IIGTQDFAEVLAFTFRCCYQPTLVVALHRKRCTVVGAGRFHQYNSYIKGIKAAAEMTYILVAIVVGRKTIFCGVPWDDYIGNSPQCSLANYISSEGDIGLLLRSMIIQVIRGSSKDTVPQ
ncbi:hypothetical protein M8C21_006188, partial [Ambrosia artemisiifolia]